MFLAATTARSMGDESALSDFILVKLGFVNPGVSYACLVQLNVSMGGPETNCWLSLISGMSFVTLY